MEILTPIEVAKTVHRFGSAVPGNFSMPKKGGIGKRGVGGNKKGSKATKRAARRAFAVRHIDQVAAVTV